MAKRKWSKDVTESSDAMDLEAGVFKKHDAHAIAVSVAKSAERSKRRKSEPYRSAMSMIVLYINRAGKHLDKRQRALLERSKDELRALYGREPARQRRR